MRIPEDGTPVSIRVLNTDIKTTTFTDRAEARAYALALNDENVRMAIWYEEVEGVIDLVIVDKERAEYQGFNTNGSPP